MDTLTWGANFAKDTQTVRVNQKVFVDRNSSGAGRLTGDNAFGDNQAVEGRNDKMAGPPVNHRVGRQIARNR